MQIARLDSSGFEDSVSERTPTRSSWARTSIVFPYAEMSCQA